MNRPTAWTACAFGLAAFLMLAGCIGLGEKVAGGHGNGSETTNGITARILAPDSSPARGVKVRLRRTDFTKGQAREPALPGARISADTLTDSQGAFTFRGLRAGEYLIESGDDSLRGVMVRQRIEGEGPAVDLRDLRLQDNGSLLGQVNREGFPDSVEIKVLFYGLDREARCAPDGSFRISLAPGQYSLKVSASSQEVGSLEIPQVSCLPGAETRLSELTLPIGYRADSLAVAAFLADAGLAAADWAKVVGVENNRIRTLNLRNLGLSSLPSSIGDLVFLRALYLDRNPLLDLPMEMAALAELHTLSLERVPLDSLPPVVPRLPSLKYLRLGKMGLGVFPMGLIGIESLEALYLDSNGLTTVPAEIGRLARLWDLNLGQNRLRNLPPEIGDLAELKNLWVHDNVLDSLPSAIGRLGKLNRLYAYHNVIQGLPPSIGDLAELDTLHLETNLIEELPPEIGSLPQLVTLYIGDNLLAELPEAITGLQLTGRLSLWGNRLCQVPSSVKAWIDRYDYEQYGGETGNIWAKLQVGCSP